MYERFLYTPRHSLLFEFYMTIGMTINNSHSNKNLFFSLKFEEKIFEYNL